MRFGHCVGVTRPIAPEALLGAYADWVDDPVRVEDAGLIIDYKTASPDPSLDRWSGEDVDALLFEYLPADVFVEDDAEADDLLDGVVSFFEFLDDGHWLADASDPGHALALHVRSHRIEFRAAMSGDEDMADRLVGAMVEDGVDLDDEAAVKAWIDALDDGPPERRDALLGPYTQEPAIELPPRPAVDPALVRESAGAAPLLSKLVAFATFMGDGRPLTSTGNVKLADARELVGLLDTSDETDWDYGGKTHGFRSATQLRWLDLVVWVAKEIGAVKVRKGQMSANRAWLARCEADPLATAEEIAELTVAPGPLTVLEGGSFIDQVRVVLDLSWVALLATAYEISYEFESSVERLAFQMADLVAGDYLYASEGGEEHLEWSVRLNLTRIFRILEWAGLIRWRGWVEVEGRWRFTERRGGTVEITPLGEWLLQNPLSQDGIVSAPIVRPLEVTLEDDPDTIVSAMSEYADHPESLVAAWEQLGGHPGLPLEWWKVDNPGTVVLLDSLGRSLPDKASAKAARKALLKHRSWMAGRKTSGG